MGGEANYIDDLALAIYNHAEPGGPPDADEMRLYRIYAVLARSKGTETTLEDVHDAWSAWKSDTFPEHRSIVPFEQLAPAVQELDREYCDAIHACCNRPAEVPA
jgi:hypothetical protein